MPTRLIARRIVDNFDSPRTDYYFSKHIGELNMATDPVSSNPLINLTETEMDVANSGPAYFTNRFLASIAQGTVRVTFVEVGLHSQQAFRTAVVMSVDNAIALSEMLQKLIQDNLAKNAETPLADTKNV